jgi:thiol-disulfide isomerase/thioredoxin
MNWPKLIVEYGQAAAWIAVFLSALATLFIATRTKPTLLRKLLSLASCLVAVFVAYESIAFLRWATTKVNPLKPVFRDANKIAPEFEFKLVADESTRSLADYRGKVVLLNLWATWRPPCREEMPMLRRLQQHYAKDGLVVIAVSDEPNEQQAKFTEFASMPFVKGRIAPGPASPASTSSPMSRARSRTSLTATASCVKLSSPANPMNPSSAASSRTCDAGACILREGIELALRVTGSAWIVGNSSVIR